MIKKVYSSKFEAVFVIVCFVIFAIIEVIFIGALINGLIKNETIQDHLLAVIGIAVYLALILFLGNRSAYTVTYNRKEKTLYRKGLFWGYEYQLKVEDIEDVVIGKFYKEGTFFVLVDPYNNRYDSCHKKSFIRLQVNDQNRDFIELFWHKPITKILPRDTMFRNR